jgi:colanic acid biosynthesis glycosyl transferase WcaI
MFGMESLPREQLSNRQLFKTMKILAIYRHYPPDSAPYARILREILEHFAGQGHDVSVFTAQPSYNDVLQSAQPWRERLRGVNICRVRLLPERKGQRFIRLMNFVYFLLRGMVHAVLVKRYDLVIANSHPPVLMGCALQIVRALLGTPYIYHCQDIHPEAAALAGDLRRKWLYRWLLRWDTATCRRAHRVVVLSRDMAESLAARGLPAENIVIINNPPLAVDAVAQPKLPPPLDDPIETVRFLFAGNLGRFQRLERLVAATRLVAGRIPCQLIFMGEGSAKSELVALAGDLLGRRIVFIPQQSVETALAAMRVCDYGVVSLMADVYRYAYPSKSMMYLAAGCPILGIVEPLSELARTITTNKLGYVAPSRSVMSIAETLVKAVAERSRWTTGERRRIEETSRDLFGGERMLAAWDEIIAGATTSQAPVSHDDHTPLAA